VKKKYEILTALGFDRNIGKIRSQHEEEKKGGSLRGGSKTGTKEKTKQGRKSTLLTTSGRVPNLNERQGKDLREGGGGGRKDINRNYRIQLSTQGDLLDQWGEGKKANYMKRGRRVEKGFLNADT